MKPVYQVRVWQITHNVNMLDQYLAVDKGFYRDQGLDVEIMVGTEGGGEVDPARLVSSGKVHFGEAGPIQFGTALREGLPLRWLLWTRQDPPHRMIGRPGIRRAQDLRGKLIAVQAQRGARGMYTYLLRRWLRESGVDPDRDVRFMERDPEDLRDFNVATSRWARQAYANSADAVVIFEEAWDLYQRLGFHNLVEPYEAYPHSSVHGLATSVEMIDQYPDLVSRMVRAHFNVAHFIREESEGTIEYIAQRWNLSETMAAQCYERMRRVFIADPTPARLAGEIEFVKGMEEVPAFPAIDPARWVEGRFAEGLVPVP